MFHLEIGDSVSGALVEGVARAEIKFAQTVIEGEKQDRKIIRMLQGALTTHNECYIMEVKYRRNFAQQLSQRAFHNSIIKYRAHRARYYNP